MTALMTRNEAEWPELFSAISSYDDLLGRIVKRQFDMRRRPQDYVVCVLAVRSFRLAIGALYLGGSGYPDIVPALVRTLWEIQLRLLLMRENPAAAALGYLMYVESKAAEMVHAEGEHRQQTGKDSQPISVSLATLQARLQSLRDIAHQLAVDPDSALRTYGKLNVRQTATKLGLEHEYRVSYAFNSGHVHERNLATPFFLQQGQDETAFEPSCVTQSSCEAVCDLLVHLGRVAKVSTLILEDPTLVLDASNLLDRVFQNVETVQARPRWYGKPRDDQSNN